VSRRGSGALGLTIAGLVALQFGVRPWLGDPRVAPDFLLLALLLYAIRSRPGSGALAGFAVGLLTDALAPAAFGAGALAHTVTGYLAAWGKAIFFADNVAVNAGFFLAGVWVRNLIVIVASGQVQSGHPLWHMLVWSPLMGLTTALVGVAVLLVLRRIGATRPALP
jgi:rod shape-determining protein MreD